MNQIENFIATSFPSQNDVKFHLLIMPEIKPIIPALCLMVLPTY